MLKLTLAAAAALLLIIPSAYAQENAYELNNWPADIDQIPCSAWEKTKDGTWVLHAAVKVGSEILEDVAVKGDAAAHHLDRSCGKKKLGSAYAAPFQAPALITAPSDSARTNSLAAEASVCQWSARASATGHPSP